MESDYMLGYQRALGHIYIQMQGKINWNLLADLAIEYLTFIKNTNTNGVGAVVARAATQSKPRRLRTDNNTWNRYVIIRLNVLVSLGIYCVGGLWLNWVGCASSFVSVQCIAADLPNHLWILSPFCCVIYLGSFGRVMLAKSRRSGEFFAMKRLKKSDIIKLRQVDHVISENTILADIEHPFLVSYRYNFKGNLVAIWERNPGWIIIKIFFLL